MNNLVCTWCKREMTYLHGHGACINNQCPMFGLNQAECCDGETVSNCVSPQKNEITLSPRALK